MPLIFHRLKGIVILVVHHLAPVVSIVVAAGAQKNFPCDFVREMVAALYTEMVTWAFVLCEPCHEIPVSFLCQKIQPTESSL